MNDPFNTIAEASRLDAMRAVQAGIDAAEAPGWSESQKSWAGIAGVATAIGQLVCKVEDEAFEKMVGLLVEQIREGRRGQAIIEGHKPAIQASETKPVKAAPVSDNGNNYDSDIIQAVQPPGLLPIKPGAIGDCFPGFMVQHHVCDTCRDRGGEINVAMIDNQGEQRFCLVLPPEQALELADVLVANVAQNCGRLIQ